MVQYRTVPAEGASRDLTNILFMSKLQPAHRNYASQADVDVLPLPQTDQLLPLLVGAVVLVWVLTIAALLLWFMRRRQKSGSHVGVGSAPRPRPASLEDNNALHTSVAAAAAREQLHHIQNPIQRAAAKNWLNDARAVGKLGAGNQERDQRLQRAGLPRAPPPPYMAVEWAEPALQPQLGKQDNRQQGRTEFLL